jgi:deoxyribodipyrimidine photolyase-like uncharacterized protein
VPNRRWLFADQLGPHFTPDRRPVLLVESRAVLHRRVYHRQKLHLTLSALRHRAAELGKSVMRLYTGQKLTRNVAWYERRGYVIERIETMPDRNVVHMVKTLNK